MGLGLVLITLGTHSNENVYVQQSCIACHDENREPHVYWNTVWEVAKFGTAAYGVNSTRALI